jgi:hypothetical protein
MLEERPVRWPRFGEVIQIAGLSLGDWEHDGNVTNDSSDEEAYEDEDEDENNNAEVHDDTNAIANTSTNDSVSPDVSTDDTDRDGQAYYHYSHRGTGLRVRLPNRQLNDFILTRM